MKKLCSVVVSLCLTLVCLCLMSIPAQAATVGTCGENITWQLSEDGILTISGTGRLEFDIDGISVPWKEHRASIKSVVIEDGITRIGEWLFRDCVNLTDVTLPEGVSGISWGAFYGCSSLTDLTLPKSVKYIGHDAFYNCDQLTAITFPADTAVEYSAFEGCDGLTDVTFLGDAELDSFVFADCVRLAEVTFRGDVSYIEESAFRNCRSLNSITFGGAAPAFADFAFADVTAVVLYPCNDATWTREKQEDYGGTLTWKADHRYQNGNCTLCGQGFPKVRGLTQTAAERYTLSVSWEKLEGAVKYWVYVDGKLYNSTTDTTLTVTKRSPGTDYQIAVTAKLEDGTLLTLTEAEVLTARTRETARTTCVAGTDFINLTWDAQGADKTWIYIGTAEDQLNVVASAAGSSFTLKKLTADTVYYLRLAQLIDGKVVLSEEVLTVKTASDEVLRVDVRLEDGALTLDWQANGDSYKYWVILHFGDRTLTYSTADTEFRLSGFDFADCTVTVKGVNTLGVYDYGLIDL